MKRRYWPYASEARIEDVRFPPLADAPVDLAGSPPGMSAWGGKRTLADYTEPMDYPATKARLGGRLAVAQMVGTACGLFLIGLLQPDPAPFTVRWWDQMTLLFIGGLIIALPAYAIGVLVLHAFTDSILRHPFRWCIGFPGGLLALSLLMPSAPHTMHWLTGISLCALVAGLVFLLWQHLRPLTALG